jgi:hypothetical protein
MPLLRSRSFALCATIVAVSLPDDSPAQSVNATSQKWLMSVGTDPFELDLRTRDPGVRGELSFSLGREWMAATSGFGWRTQLTVGGDLPHGLRFQDGSCSKCEVGYSRLFGSIAGLATYQWRRERTFQPYVIAGPSLHLARTEFTVKDGFLTRRALEQIPLPSDATRWSAGFSTGIGATFRLGRRSIFVEQSVLMPEIFGRNARGWDHAVRPLSIGIRF